MRIVFLTDELTSDRVRLLEAVRQRGEEVSVLLMSHEFGKDAADEISASLGVEVLPGFHFRRKGEHRYRHWNYGIMAALTRARPDIVVNEGCASSTIRAMLYCRWRGRPYIAWTGRAFAGSGLGQEALARGGAQTERSLTTVAPVDVRLWSARAETFRISREALQLRAHYGSPILLSHGEDGPSGGHADLFEIYAGIERRRPQAALVILGDGPCRARREEEARRRGWSRIHWAGQVPRGDLHRYFAIADVWVSPCLRNCSEALIGEAMAAQVPVVASTHTQATLDLIDDGVTGYRIDPRDAAGSTDAILKVLSLSEERRQAVIAAASERIAKWDIEPVADALVGFLKSVCRTAEARR